MKQKKPLYDPQTGIHRAKTWEIALYALNNASTNLYTVVLIYITYFLTGVVGVTVAVAGTISVLLRMWDGVTDPFVGFIVDKTNGKFGKNRPFIALGQLVMFIGTALIFLACPRLPQTARFPFYIVCYMFYIVGYTFQCVVTKSAQSCLTNDPEQRPLFSLFDTINSTLIYSFGPALITAYLVPHYNILDEAGNIVTDAFYNPDFFTVLWSICAALSLICAVLAIIGLWRKDRQEFYGTGAAQKIRLRDYWDTLRHNRAIQMLCVAACSDKLSVGMQTSSVVMVMLFGIIVGNYGEYASFSAITGVLVTVVSMILVMTVARKMGQKQALLIGTYGGIIGAVILFFMLWLGNPANITFSSLNFYTILFVLVYIVMKGFGSVSSSIVIPMTADCADYETYRSGKYVPGLMGTLFSFIDKLISSLAGVIVSLLLVAIGFKDVQPTQSTPYSTGIFWVTMFCFLGAPIIGWILNVIAMKFYPLTKEKMAEIQEKIADIKAKAMS